MVGRLWLRLSVRLGVEPASCIVIKEKMLEDSCMVDDIGQWEHGAFA